MTMWVAVALAVVGCLVVGVIVLASVKWGRWRTRAESEEEKNEINTALLKTLALPTPTARARAAAARRRLRELAELSPGLHRPERAGDAGGGGDKRGDQDV